MDRTLPEPQPSPLTVGLAPGMIAAFSRSTLRLETMMFCLRDNRFCLVGLLVAMLLATGCAGKASPKVPPLAEAAPHLPGKVVWHELVTPDLDASRRFYGGLLGWTFEAVGNDYLICRHRGQLVGGMAEVHPALLPAAYWVPLISVPDVDQAVRTAEAAGGAVQVAPVEFADRGRIGVVEDPSGAVFGFIHTSRGDPADGATPANGTWLWDEIWTADVAKAEAFYRPIAAYRATTRPRQGRAYRVLQTGAIPRVGLVEKPDPRIGNAWLAYLRADDPAALATRAKALGGAILLAPHPDVAGGKLAIIRDPQGAGLVIQKWTPQGDP